MKPAAQTIARQAQFAVVPSAVPPATCSMWLAPLEAAYRCIEVAQRADFVAESSSFRLRAVAAVSVVDVWSALSSQLRARCVTALGPLVAIDADESWVRRQYDPKSAPPRHRPHSWHQDGALRYEFSPRGRATIDDAPLKMVTCWIALEPCGVDAPGLEFVTDRIGRMLSPSQLADVAIDQQWPTSRRARPALEVGDALVFGGDVLHRTHVSAAMSRSRTSIELRCFRADAIPDRIADDEFVAVPTNDIESASSRTGT